MRRKKHFNKKKDNFSIKKEYSDSIRFIKESKEFIYAAVLIFFIFSALGFFFNDLINNIAHSIFGINLNEEIVIYLKSLVLKTEGMNLQQLLGFIFFNNIQSSFFGMLIGSFFAIFPLIGIIFNGYVLGFVAAASVNTQGIWVLWKILPHGIFELPAVFIALGLGIKLGSYLFVSSKKNFFNWLVNSLKVFLLWVLPLLIIAAIIESVLIFFS